MKMRWPDRSRLPLLIRCLGYLLDFCSLSWQYQKATMASGTREHMMTTFYGEARQGLLCKWGLSSTSLSN